MRYLVTKQVYDGEGQDRTLPLPRKLARFAFVSDARSFAERLAKENDCVYSQVLDTHLKRKYYDSREGVL